eukprot:5475490-Amphidinium_carterae.1
MVGRKRVQPIGVAKAPAEGTLYAALGVARDASPTTIRSAYRRKALLAHPDRGGSQEEFVRLSKALEVLNDPHQRAAYDRDRQEELAPHFSDPSKLTQKCSCSTRDARAM